MSEMWSNICIIHPLVAELFYADRRTDRPDETNGRFSKLCERA